MIDEAEGNEWQPMIGDICKMLIDQAYAYAPCKVAYKGDTVVVESIDDDLIIVNYGDDIFATFHDWIEKKESEGA